MIKQNAPLQHNDAEAQITNVIMAMKHRANMDLEFHKANILSEELKQLYASLANNDIYSLFQKFFESSVQELATVMVQEYFNMFISQNGIFKRIKFSSSGQNAVELMMETKDSDDNSALIAFTCRDIINMKYNRVGLSLDVLVVEESDEMDFEDKSVLNAVDPSRPQAQS